MVQSHFYGPKRKVRLGSYERYLAIPARYFFPPYIINKTGNRYTVYREE